MTALIRTARTSPITLPVTYSGKSKDFQGQTTFAHLSSNNVPWVVIPENLFHKENIPPNAISAVICSGKMFYAIMGDTNGDHPQTIGEASILLGKTCFPNGGITGHNGHDTFDVLCTILVDGIDGRYRIQNGF